MEKLILLGTGNANVTKCYNTCFVIQNKEQFFLVDTGGGNGILCQMEKAKIPIEKIHHIFLSHGHTDHILGAIWLIRMVAAKMLKGAYEGELYIYCHNELAETIMTIAKLTIQSKFFRCIGEKIFIYPVNNKDKRKILEYDVEFFDIESTKAKQYGFATTLKNGKQFVFLGDEPYKEHEFDYVDGADWLLHEAFCLYREREKFEPYKKNHTTVKEAGELAEKLKVKNLLLYHTEDENIQNRKRLYTEEAMEYYRGNIFVPDDLETIFL